MIVQDRDLSDSGELRTGNVGDMLLVIGTFGPFLDVTAEVIRLRQLNASNARVYDFGFSDDRGFSVVGSDGGMLSAPVDLHRLAMSPGERAEILAWMRPGETVVLRPYQPDLGVNWFPNAFRRQKGPTRPARAACRRQPRSVRSAATNTRPVARPDRHRGRRAGRAPVRAPSQRHQRPGDGHGPHRRDRRGGQYEIWEMTNADGDYHNFHVHGVQFQILDINGDLPPPEFAGWKDTVFLEPGDTVRIAMLFTKYADPSLPYMFHCHRLRHEDEDRGMMGQFVVVDQGQQLVPPNRDDTGNAHIHRPAKSPGIGQSGS